jgi:hypothetical protein
MQEMSLMQPETQNPFCNFGAKVNSMESSTCSGSGAMDDNLPEISDYERLRKSNISRNNAILDSLDMPASILLTEPVVTSKKPKTKQSSKANPALITLIRLLFCQFLFLGATLLCLLHR